MRELLRPLVDAGAKPLQVERVVRAWLAGQPLDERCSPRRGPLSARALALLPELERALDAVAAVASEHAAGDGGARLLVRLADGATVESVLLPRGAQCLSTQVGCAVGCAFCMTGRGGLARNLTSAEILAQLALGRRRRAVRRVVLMGMGEPMHNLAAVLEALEHMGTAGGLGHKELVFSTVGEPRVFERLAAARVKPALALSLHSTSAERRAELLPRAPRVEPRELLEAALDYGRRTGHPLQLQWTLLAGINDGEEELARLAEWLAGARAVVNFIPYNTLPASSLQPTSLERARAMIHALADRGVLAKLRRTVAYEVEAACGMLRARELDGAA